MSWKIQLCELNYDHEETEAINGVMAREWLTMGDECAAFEREFSDFIEHNETGVLVSSATAGLHLILMSLDIGAGDEVIIPGLTFVSDANVVLQLGAKPIFADSVSTTNFNVSVDDIINSITSKTKAIVVVHFAGFPINLNRLIAVCNAKDIKLIEDCAHSPGAKYGDIFTGCFGDFSFFSFFSNKNLAVGEGGMVFANSPTDAEKIRLMRSHGMTSVTLDRHKGRAVSYDVLHAGLNYRCDELRASIGRVQLRKLRLGNLKRKELYDAYVNHFENSQITMAFSSDDNNSVSAYHLALIILPHHVNRLNIISSLKKAGIQTSIHYPNFKNFSAYSEITKDLNLPVVNDICDRELTLPLHPRMDQVDITYVANKVLENI
jgi:dTDP-4-amino-4,6-dideoxygalactose transaminase